MVKINKYIERAQLKCETHTQTPEYMHIHHMDGKRERKKSTNATRAEKNRWKCNYSKFIQIIHKQINLSSLEITYIFGTDIAQRSQGQEREGEHGVLFVVCRLEQTSHLHSTNFFYMHFPGHFRIDVFGLDSKYLE